MPENSVGSINVWTTILGALTTVGVMLGISVKANKIVDKKISDISEQIKVRVHDNDFRSHMKYCEAERRHDTESHDRIELKINDICADIKSIRDVVMKLDNN